MEQSSIKDSGFSIIELIISVAIAVTCITIGTNFFVKSYDHRKEIEVNSRKESEFSDLVGKIKRYLVARTDVGADVQQDSLTLKLRNFEEVNNEIRLSNGCRDIPNITSTSIAPRSSGSECLNLLACGTNQANFIRIEYVNPQLGQNNSTYPSRIFYDTQAKQKYGIIGYGICFKKDGGYIEMKIVSTSSSRDRSKMTLKHEEKQFSIPLKTGKSFLAR